jgi:hypothetical protein
VRIVTRWQDDEALGSHLDHHVRHPAENTHDFREVLAENSRRLRLGAAEPDVLPDGVPSPAARELGVVRDQSCAAVSGIDGDSVIRRVVEIRLRGRPAVTARVEQNSADGDGDVVVEEEPQGGEVSAGRRMAIADDVAPARGWLNSCLSCAALGSLALTSSVDA